MTLSVPLTMLAAVLGSLSFDEGTRSGLSPDDSDCNIVMWYEVFHKLRIS